MANMGNRLPVRGAYSDRGLRDRYRVAAFFERNRGGTPLEQRGNVSGREPGGGGNPGTRGSEDRQ